ncbi:unnamed protein product [Penicillium salamii]|uniref:RTA-like protein n=1 Tax=Penicillium salamii TaxID=1612424 RepID=A0A9W4JD60_9EURO|nr:unnamed protein product [Penicillium salamii]CAG7985768.1 unnamed protein product [Penicillium salamii]CAG8077550.1 unnamed protein product [Penicillium salamii]CAG8249841.1 unnamed protein product [Penicillium salamii]CAG8285357.1 unnamed protein product [Penicillium salamii]
MSDPEGHIDFQLYRYTPSLPAAVIFIAVFVFTTAYHIYQLVKCRAWYFIAFVLGGICESSIISKARPESHSANHNFKCLSVQIIGYIARAKAHSDTESVPIYSIQTILILLAPPLYAASIYMVLGRLIVHLGAESSSIVPLKWMTGIFVTGDVIAFIMQAAGGGIMASGTISAMKTGEHITIGGLCVQLVFFTFFVITSIIFHRRMRQRATIHPTEVRESHGLGISRSWESVLWGLYIASILILIRSVFRLIEYAQGNDGYLISHEAFMYVFDSTLMFFAMVAMNVFHPSIILSPVRKDNRHSLEVLRPVG